MTTEDVKWLVRGSGLVLGPFSKNQILERLLTKEVSVHYEVAYPLEKWAMIQNHPQFIKTVQEYKERDAGGSLDEMTMTSTVDQFTQTATSGEPLNDELTEKVDPGLVAPEIVYEDVKEIPMSSSSSAGGPQARYQIGGTEAERRTDRAAASSSRSLWVLTLILILCALGFIGFRQFVAKPRSQLFESQKVFSQAMRAIAKGEGPQALELLKRVSPETQKSPEVSFWLAVLKMREEGQTLEARKVLNELKFQSPSEEALRLVALGLADLMDESHTSAVTQFQKALEVKKDSIEAKLSLAHSFEELGRKDEAAQIFQEVSQHASLGRLASMRSFLLQVSAPEENNRSLARSLDNVIRIRADYVQEGFLFRSYLALLGQDKELAEENLTKSLDSDPEMNRQMVRNLLLHPKVWPDEKVFEICREVTSAFDTAQSLALMSICSAKTQRMEQAQIEIESSIEKETRESLVWAAQAFVLNQGSQPEKASLAIGKSSEFNADQNFAFPLWYQAKFCLEVKDYDCASSRLRELSGRPTFRIQAMTALAQIAFLQNRIGEAEKLLSQSGGLVRGYKKALKLREDLSRATSKSRS